MQGFVFFYFSGFNYVIVSFFFLVLFCMTANRTVNAIILVQRGPEVLLKE